MPSDEFNAYPPIVVRRETYLRLLNLGSDLQKENKKRYTFNETIETLLDYYEINFTKKEIKS